MSLISMVIFAGTLSFSGLVEGQHDAWNIFKGHIPAFIAFVVFIIAGTAETNRGPFDLAEAESELTAGFHTEYSGIKFALFFLAEFINMFIVAAVASTVFLGGWMPLHFGSFESFNHIMDLIPPIVWFFGKSFFIVFLIMWLKWTFPRLRVDQILTLEWKYLLPINLFNILLMTIVVLTKFHF
jgi:NADH-quinone oxidoreductase subunit H